MNITYTPTYPVLSRNSDITYLVTYSVLITIRIYRLIPLPEDFYSLWKKLWKITCLLTVSQWPIICGYCWCSGQWWCIP